jgi:hypothetical protein
LIEQMFASPASVAIMYEILSAEENNLLEVDVATLTTAELIDHTLALEAVQVRLDVARRRLLAVRNARRTGLTVKPPADEVQVPTERPGRAA